MRAFLKAKRDMRIPVLPYIRKFLWHQYGPGDRFDLRHYPRHPLRLSILYLGMTAEIIPQADRLAPTYIDLEVAQDDGDLHQALHQFGPWITGGAIFQHEFNTALRLYVEAQRDLAASLGLNTVEWNARIALENFLRTYGIEEHEYSYESLRRQWTRQSPVKIDLAARQLSAKYGFCPTENQEVRLLPIVPPAYWGGQRPRISFHAYSRGQEDVVRKEICVPKRLLQTGQALDYAQVTMSALTRLLRQGVTIA